MKRKQILLFDLGGVLLQLNDPADTFGLQISEEEFLRIWIHSKAVRRFEQGSIGAPQFAAEITHELKLTYDADEFLRRFARWPGQLFPEIAELLKRLHKRYRLALLSNTNAIHWQESKLAARLGPSFDRVFLSYVTGLLKPDADAFRHVQKCFACAPDEIVFFDDNKANVSAARKIGFESRLTRGPVELAAALSTLKIT